MKKSTLVVALVAGAASFTVLADTPSVTRIFRAPRHTRGNTNIMKVQPIDDAAWIWLKGDSGMSQIGEGALGAHPSGGSSMRPTFLRFRNEFEVKEGDGKLTIDVSADERFYLTCDGAFVARGPNRSTVENWQYNTYEIELKPGRHVFEATVWKIGDKGPLAQLSWRGGFILKANETFDRRLSTGVATWKVGRLAGFEPAGADNGVWGTGSQWKITGSGIIAGEPAAWSDAVVVRGFAGQKGPQIWGGRTNALIQSGGAFSGVLSFQGGTSADSLVEISGGSNVASSWSFGTSSGSTAGKMHLRIILRKRFPDLILKCVIHVFAALDAGKRHLVGVIFPPTCGGRSTTST